MKRAKLLWVDLEMTGLDPEQDKILEIAAITTDWDLNPLATFEAIVKVDDQIIASRMVGEFWKKNQASYNSLVAQNATGQPLKAVEQNFLAFLDAHFKKNSSSLATPSTKIANSSTANSQKSPSASTTAGSTSPPGKFTSKAPSTKNSKNPKLTAPSPTSPAPSPNSNTT